MVIPAGFLQVTYRHHNQASLQDGVCTLGVTASVATPQQQADDLMALWRDFVVPHIANAWSFDGVILADSAGTIAESFASSTGGVSEAGSPPQVCYLVRKLTGQGGRRKRGRLYVPGVVDSVIDDAGTISPTQVAALNEGFASMLEAMSGVTTDSAPVILHSDATAPTPITAFQTMTRCATQRRRLG